MEMFVFAVGRDRCRRLVVFLVMIQSVENVTVIGETQSCLSSFWIPIFDSMFLLDTHLPDKNIFLGWRTDATFHCFHLNMLYIFAIATLHEVSGLKWSSLHPVVWAHLELLLLTALQAPAAAAAASHRLWNIRVMHLLSLYMSVMYFLLYTHLSFNWIN